MTGLSLCCIALNEGERLADMLESVSGLATEIILGLDARTTDDTAEIARGHGAKVVPVEWRDDFSYARNLTLDQATEPWVLVLDADEVLTEAGRQAVRAILENASPEPPIDAPAGFMFGMVDKDLNGHVLIRHNSSGRMFRHRPEIRYHGVVHEEPLFDGDPDRTSWILIVGAPSIEHVGFDPQVWQERRKGERNVRLLEKRLAADPDDAYARHHLMHEGAAL